MKMLKKGSKEKYRVIRKVVRLQREVNLIPPNASILIALSGGADSIALTLSLLELRNFLKIKKLGLAHVNHMLRDEESFRDEEFCVSFAQKVGLPIYVERVDIKSLSKGENVEAVAREERYSTLRRIKEKEGFDLIATAHHLNDLVETILLWMTRGCGLEGLLGFEAKEGDIIRPLYRVKREEILDFLMSCGQTWVEDSSNYDLSIARNRIRHKVIPELKAINPNLEETLLRMREVLKSDNSVLNDLLSKKCKEILNTGFDRKVFLRLPKEYQRAILNRCYGIKDYRKIEQTIREITKSKSFSLEKHVNSDILNPK